MTCPSSGVACPRTPCPGTTDPGICRHWGALTTWRALGPAEQARRIGQREEIDPPGDATAPRPAGLAAELVIARYNEDARWAEDLAS